MNRKDRIIGAPHTAPDTVLFTYTVHTYQRMFCRHCLSQNSQTDLLRTTYAILGLHWRPGEKSNFWTAEIHVINGNSRWATKQGVIPTLGIKWKAICWQNNVDEDCKNIQSIRRFAAPSSQNSWHVLPLRHGCEWQQPLWQADEWLLLCF